jgi:hypothetical protein
MKKWIRKLIGGLSFTTALFVFQACYGGPQDCKDDVYIHGVVKSVDGVPVEGIEVSTDASRSRSTLSDTAGAFGFYVPMRDSITVMFRDIDADKNGLYADRDTTVTDMLGYCYNESSLDIILDYK